MAKAIETLERVHAGQRQDLPCNCAIHLTIRMDSVQTTGEKAAYLRSIMRLTWKDKVTNKEILGRIGLPSMEDLLKKESPVEHLNVIRQTTKADPLLSIVFWSQTERTPSSKGYHQEKPQAERHPTHGHHSHSRELNGVRRSRNESSLCRIATDNISQN